MTRRTFTKIPLAAAALAESRAAAGAAAEEAGAQRLSLNALRAWEALGFGMFLHFGMSTYDGDELSQGDKPSTLYNPTRLDVDQWVAAARDAGMKYAVLTTKHVAGHCLWPTRLNDYHVGTSGNKTDVVGAFVKACAQHGVMPGFYYCSWDNHNRFGSLTWSDTMALQRKGKPEGATIPAPYVTREYEEFQTGQLRELLTGYGNIGEVWIDIPSMLSPDYRSRLYRQIAAWQPQAVIMMNHGFGDGSVIETSNAWPTDLLALERTLPNSHAGYARWRTIEDKRCYLPGEMCDTIGKEWFFVEQDRLRPDGELLGMYLVARARGVNLLLDVPPDRSGVLPVSHVESLARLRKNIDRLGVA